MHLKTIALTLGLLPAAVGSSFAAGQASDKPIPASAADVRPLLIGASVPEVSLRTVEGRAVSLAETVRAKPTVLIFYRGGWCPFCNRHLSQLQSAQADLVRLGYQIIAVSPDRPEKLGESIGKHKLTYTLLSDASMTVAKAFGIAFRVDAATLEKYKGYGIDLEAASGQAHHQLPVPAVFIVGTDGKIRFVYANPDYKTRLSSEVLLSAARACLATPGQGKSGGKRSRRHG